MLLIIVAGIMLTIGIFQIKKFTPVFLSEIYLGCMWGAEVIVSVYKKNLYWMNRNIFVSIVLMVLIPVIILLGYFFISSIFKLGKKEENE